MQNAFCVLVAEIIAITITITSTTTKMSCADVEWITHLCHM